MTWKQNLLAAVWGLAACGMACAAPTNLVSKTNYVFFSVIPDRNIFNPNRYPHRVQSARSENERTAPANAFMLVGTMSSAKGTFAFFDGSTADYQKVLERDGEIAGCKLVAIQPNAVLLAVSNNIVMEVPVGAQLRLDAEAGWQVVRDAGTQLVDRAETPAASPTAAAEVNDPGDILKKQMQKREMEMQ